MPTPDETPTAITDGTADASNGPTTSSSVHDRLQVLAGLAVRPLHEHAEVYQGLHVDLQAALAEIDTA